MNKETYIEKFSAIKKQQEVLRVELSKLMNDYIQTNMSFKVGDKVKVISGKTGAVSFGIIRKYFINFDRDVIPIIGKIKKNGEIHPNQNVDYRLWAKDVIEPCND